MLRAHLEMAINEIKEIKDCMHKSPCKCSLSIHKQTMQPKELMKIWYCIKDRIIISAQLCVRIVHHYC